MKQSQFPLFSSSIDCAHSYWKQFLTPGSWVIDATCGNGHDTLFLASHLDSFKKPFGIIAIDIQNLALQKTRALFENHSHLLPNIHFFCQSHEEFPPCAYENPIHLIVYNLGYLPSGDKTKTTLTSTTINSVCSAQNLLHPGGVISITCYPGHNEGKQEEEALLSYTSQLPQNEWNVSYFTSINRKKAPSLILLQKTI